MAFERRRKDSPQRRGSMVSERSWADDEQQPLIAEPLNAEDEAPASWLTLPKKGQLFTLAMCRLSEPLVQTSLLSYLYFQLRSFHADDEEPPSPAAISRQAGIIASAFAGSQCLTGMIWGRLSDTIGRKPCILIGLLGTALSVLGFGFATSFKQALAFRIMGGCLNGNVGVLRTMVSELIREPRHQSRAFLVMPMCFNIGIIIGPALGGLLADPAANWKMFENVHWMLRYPYAFPNVVSTVFLLISWSACFLFLQETLPSQLHRRDIGRELGAVLGRFLRRHTTSRPETPTEATPLIPKEPEQPLVRPPFRQMFTPNILLTLLTFSIIPLHNATFLHIYTLFLSTPRASSTPTHLTGGLGLRPHSVGMAMSLLGFLGILMQLFFYPPFQAKLGLLRSFRLACLLFPIAYLATPWLTLIPATGGWRVWAGIGAVLMLQVAGRTFALPGSVILLTRSVEREGIMGTVHGVGSSAASLSRAVGPLVGAWVYAWGLDRGDVGGLFWGMAGVAGVGAAVGGLIREGRGLAG